MTRITTTVLVFLLLLNGTAQIMSVSGLDDNLGVELNPGGDQKMDDAVQEAKSGFNPELGIVESLLSLVAAGIGLFNVFISSAWAAPAMLEKLLGGGQVVSTIITMMMLPMYVISTLEILYLATGRDLV